MSFQRWWWSDAAALFLLTCIASNAEAAPKRESKPSTLQVFHDGVAMSLTRQDTGEIEIAYIEVPAMLRELGVKAGTVLVRAKWAEDNFILVGEAFMFSKNCAPMAYAVRGVVTWDNVLIVVGPTPVSCENRALQWGEAAVMTFEQPRGPRQRIGPERPKQEKPVTKPKPKAKPKPRPRPEPTPQPQQWQWMPWREQWR